MNGVDLYPRSASITSRARAESASRHPRSAFGDLAHAEGAATAAAAERARLQAQHKFLQQPQQQIVGVNVRQRAHSIAALRDEHQRESMAEALHSRNAFTAQEAQDTSNASRLLSCHREGSYSNGSGRVITSSKRENSPPKRVSFSKHLGVLEEKSAERQSGGTMRRPSLSRRSISDGECSEDNDLHGSDDDSESVSASRSASPTAYFL